MNRIFFIISALVSFSLAQTTYPGLNAWTHGQTVGLAGGGYLFANQNEFRNPAMLPDSTRHFKINMVKYPAGISGQSIIINGQRAQHRFGIKANRLNYGQFDGRDLNNNTTGDYSAGDIHIQAAYGKAFNSGRFVFGISGGFFMSAIENEKANVFTLSPGIIFHSRIVKTGLSLQNYGTVLKSYSNVSSRLPSVVIASFSRGISGLPLIFEVDYIHSTNGQDSNFILSSLLYLKKWLDYKKWYLTA